MKLKKLFTSIFMILASISFAQEDNSIQQSEARILQLIVNNSNSCVEAVDQGKIYLKSDRIHPTADGLYLVLNDQNEYVQLPKLLSDDFGCFYQYSPQEFESIEISSRRHPDILNKCPSCGEPYFVKCKNPNCQVNIDKEKDKEKKKNK